MAVLRYRVGGKRYVTRTGNRVHFHKGIRVIRPSWLPVGRALATRCNECFEETVAIALARSV